MAKNRPNVIPIIEDARHPQKYRMLVPMVDVVFADVAQPDQVSCMLLCCCLLLCNSVRPAVQPHQASCTFSINLQPLVYINKYICQASFARCSACMPAVMEAHRQHVANSLDVACPLLEARC